MPNNFEDLEKSIEEFKQNVQESNELCNILEGVKNATVDSINNFNNKSDELLSNIDSTNKKYIDSVELAQKHIDKTINNYTKSIESLQSEVEKKIREYLSSLDTVNKTLDAKYTDLLNKLESTNVFALNGKLTKLNSKTTVFNIINIILLIVIATITILRFVI